MNMIEQQNYLESMDDAGLVEMSQNPTYIPAFLVLQEVKRRSDFRKNYQAMEQQPTTTVAEEVVGEFMQPQLAQNQSQGLQGGTPQSATPLLDSNISAGLSGVPTAPMQMAASGGIVGYKNKGKTEYKEAADDYGKQLQEIFEKEGRYKKRYSDYESGERFFSPLNPRNYVVDDEEYARLKRMGAVMGEGDLQDYRPIFMLMDALDQESGPRYMSESKLKGLKTALKQSVMEDRISQMGMAEGGVTGYAAGDRTALNASFQNPNANQFSSASNQDIPKEVLEEVETIGSSRGADFLKFAGVLKEDGSIDPLGATLAVATLHPIGRAASWVTKAGIGIGKKYLPGIATGLKGIAQKGYNKAFTRPELIQGQGFTMQTGKNVFSPAKTLGTLSTAAVPAAIVKNISDSAQEQYAIDEANKKPKVETPETPENIETNSSAGLSQAKDNTGNWRDLARLGAGIMSAKNVGEIGDTVTSIVDAQDKRDVQGLQSRYMQIQTEKLEADIAAMPLKELIAAQNSLSASIKAKNESGSMLTPEEIIEINKLYEFYNAEIARRQGFVAETKSAGQDANVIASYG